MFEPMQKFIAKIVYKIVCTNSKNVDQFDEQLIYIEARDYHEAFLKARLIGVKNEDEVSHESGTGIYWKFIDISYLKLIVNLSDGQELFSCIHEFDAEDNYERFIKTRAEEIQLSFDQTLTLA